MDEKRLFSRRKLLLAGAAALPSWILAGRSLPFETFAGDLQSTEPLRKPKFIETQWIEMPDGAKLAARIILPDDAEQHPVGAVFEYIPYRLRDWYRPADTYWGTKLAERGFALVRVDIRGSGDSDGLIGGEYLEPEQRDAVDIIRWISRQRWCNGSVGMTGASWGAFSALHAANAAPKELKAIVSVCGSENGYLEDSHYLGGAILMDNVVWGAMLANVCASPPDPQVVGERWRDMWQQRLDAAGPRATAWIRHQHYDDFWKRVSYTDYIKVKCAVYIVDGLVDPYIDQAPRLLSRLECPRKALIGPWAHAGPNGRPGPSLDWVTGETRWWKQWLNSQDTGIMKEPMIHSYMAYASPARQFPGATPGRWVADNSWPSPSVTPVPFYLTRHGLSRHRAGGARISYAARQTVGLKTIWWCPTELDQELPQEQSEDDRLCLLFDSPPLDHSLEILGNPLVRIRVRADSSVAKLVVRLTEVDEQGKSWLVSYGALNLTHRTGHEHPTALVPGHDYDVEVPLYFTARRFAKGSRIRIAISESLWPMMWPSPRSVMLEITPGASAALLPVRVSHDEHEDATPLPLIPVLKPPSNPHSGDEGTKGLTIDVKGPMERRQVRLVQDDPYGKAHIDDIDLDVEIFHLSIDHRIIEGDPNSSVWSGAASCSWARPGWKIEMNATYTMTSTPEEFVLQEGLKASENDQLVADKKWSNRITRELV